AAIAKFEKEDSTLQVVMSNDARRVEVSHSWAIAIVRETASGLLSRSAPRGVGNHLEPCRSASQALASLPLFRCFHPSAGPARACRTSALHVTRGKEPRARERHAFGFGPAHLRTLRC